MQITVAALPNVRRLRRWSSVWDIVATLLWSAD